MWEVGGAWAQPLHLHAFAARIATAALAPHGETAKAIQALLSLQWPQAVCCAPLAHDVFGNPFRPVSFNPLWRSPDVCSLAGPAYQERLLPCGRLEPARLAVLADALEDAGCTSDEVLGHLRGPGPHVRGCWALDLTLGFR